jgi:hypothetical protein
MQGPGLIRRLSLGNRKYSKKSSAQIEAIGCQQQGDKQPGGAKQGNLLENSGTGWREGERAREGSYKSSHLRPPEQPQQWVCSEGQWFKPTRQFGRGSGTALAEPAGVSLLGPRSLCYERCRLGPGVITQSEHIKFAQIDILPEYRFVVIGPVDLDVPDATIVVIIELYINACLVLQGLAEFVVPFVKAVIRPIEPQKLDGIAGLVDTETLRLSAAKAEQAARDIPMIINAEKIDFICNSPFGIKSAASWVRPR